MFWYNVDMNENTPEWDEFEYEEPSEQKPKKRIGPRGYALLALALLLVGACAVAYGTRGIPVLPKRMTDAIAQKRETPAPAPSPTPTPPAETPGPAALPEQTPDAAQYERTAFVVDGTSLGVLASREAAETVQREAIAWFELQILGGGTLETTLENEITFEPAAADDTVGDTTSDALFALLTGPETPLRLKSTLTEDIVAYTQYESVAEEDETLLVGTHITMRYGVGGETHTITTRTFLNGTEQGKPETVTVTAREAVDELVRIGTQRVEDDAEPGKREGKKGRSAGELTFRHPTAAKRIESNYGQRAGVLHLGLDYSGKGGEEVYASCAGVVVSAIERGGYGLMVEIDHGDGFVTRYAHLDAIAVAIGEVVAAGDVIGTLGSSGNTGAPHLHFELRIDGIAYNPRYYLD